MLLHFSCAYRVVYQANHCKEELTWKGIEQYSRVNYETEFSSYQFAGGFFQLDRSVNFCHLFWGDREFGTNGILSYNQKIHEFEWVSRLRWHDLPFLVIPGISKRTIHLFMVLDERSL
jgi:hypothetical protein